MVVDAPAGQEELPALRAVFAVAAVGAAGLVAGDDLAQADSSAARLSGVAA